MYVLTLASCDGHYGRAPFVYCCPLLILLFMIRCRNLFWQLIDQIATASSQLGVDFHQTIRHQRFRRGNVIDLGLQAASAEACDGCVIFPLMTLGF